MRPHQVLVLFLGLLGSIEAEAAQRIDRVEINGVTEFSQNEIERTLELGPGDFLDRGKVLRTIENLTGLYRNRGYQEVSVTEKEIPVASRRDGSVVLDYEVVEGRPTLVSEIRLSPLFDHDTVLARYWSVIEPRLREKVTLKPGDLLDQEKIASVRHSLQELLNSEEFVGAKVEDVRLSAAVPPVGLKPRVRPETWQSLEFRIDLGDRVTFGFRGNEVVTSGRLGSIIEELKVIGLGRDYVEAIRIRFEDEYRNLGFAQVSVQAFPVERPELHERHITYVIDEGPRIRIESLRFDGNTVFKEKELKDRFYARASEQVAHGYFVEKDVQKAAELLIEYLQSRGYLAAKLITINHSYALKPRKLDSLRSVEIVIFLYEGEQTLIHAVDITGNRAISHEQIKKTLGITEDAPLNLFSFTDGLEALKSTYRNKGYLSMRIENESAETVVRYADDDRSANISLEIFEGPQFRVGKISIEGLSQTKEFVVRRELLFREGEVLEESQIALSEARLHKLGIFSVIAIRSTDDPTREDLKNMQVSVQEGTPGVIAVGAGLRNDLGFRVFNQLGYQNLWGDNHTLIFDTTANHRFQDFHFAEYEAQLAYVWPWFMWGATTFRPTLTLSGTQYIDFDAVTAQLALTWERKILSKPNLTGIFTYSLERINQFNAQNIVDNQGLVIGSVIPSIRLDMRDNPLSPTAGFFGLLSYEVASPWLLSQHDPFPIGYTIANFRGDFYQPLPLGLVGYLSFRTGYERTIQSQVYDESGALLPTSGSIPLIKQFALGGISSLRGYQDQELNFRYRNIFQMCFVNYRSEVDFPFSGALKLAGFLDAANLNYDHFSFGNLLYGAGFGLRYQTPVGPVNLDWGFKLNPEPGTGTQQFYFSIGVI